MVDEPFDPAVMLAALHDANVRFVLIGGMAAVLHGDVGVTLDIDIAPAKDADNLNCLAAALRALDARVRTAGREPWTCPSPRRAPAATTT